MASAAPYLPAPLLRPGQAAVTCQILLTGSPATRVTAPTRPAPRTASGTARPGRGPQLAKQSHTTCPGIHTRLMVLTLASSPAGRSGRQGRARARRRALRPRRNDRSEDPTDGRHPTEIGEH